MKIVNMTMTQKEYKRNRINKGICVHCNNIATHGIRCEYHRNYHNEHGLLYDKKRRKKRYNEYKCVRCGNILHEEIDKGHSNCLACREHILKY